MSDIVITEEQARALYDAAFDLCAYVAADACRVVYEWPSDANLVPYLETLPVGVMRKLDEIVAAIDHAKMDTFEQEEQQRAKYAQAMEELRNNGLEAKA